MYLKPHKINVLYHYYLKNGFQCTTDEIVAGMHISKKTFFNRYWDKENSIVLAMRYWRQLVRERFRNKCLLCNHSVEELVLFIGELHWLKEQETPYYEYEYSHNGFLSPESPFLGMLDHILDHGIRCYHFQEDIDKDTYSKFLLFNLTNYCFIQNDSELLIHYLLSPLLTERGQTLFEEINLDVLMCP